ncbi:MAG: hypothetical protein H7834_14725 [Magnetococcus sp. YQC-9]
MTPASWNHLGARVAPFLLAACLGLELARVTWLAVPDRQPVAGSTAAQSEKSQTAQNRVVSSTTLLEGMRAFNPWETVVEKEKPPVPPPVVKETVVDSKLELNLIGSMLLPQHSWAVLTRKKDPNNQIVLQIGEEVDGAFLKKIERNAVYFDNRGRIERIVMLDALRPEGAAGQLATSGAASPASASTTATLGTLTRQEYDTMLGKGMGLLAGVNITPFYQGSDSVGYRLKFSESKTEFTKLGLVNDDVIRQVNGIPVTDPQKIGQLAGQLKGLSSVRIDMIRDNQPMTLELTIGN